MGDDDIVALALSHAQTTSSRAGVSWSLATSNKTLLTCDATIAGSNPQKLELALKKYRFSADHLFLSIEPIPGIFRIADLVRCIDASSLSRITFGKRLPEQVADRNWRQWEAQWDGETTVLEPNAISESINYGIEKLRTSGRPWVTCVTAASFTGMPVSLNSLKKEFGFQSFLAQQINQSRAMFYTSSQSAIVGSLPSINVMDEEVESYEINCDQSLEPLLRHCATEQCYSVVILSDMRTLSYLINENLVDEVVHHITNAGCRSSAPFSATDHQQLSDSLFGLRDWKLIDSAVAGECNRLILCCRAPVPNSGSRLN